MTKPSRSAEKGRQARLVLPFPEASTRIDSQLRIMPKVMGASLPPVSMMSAMPILIRWKAPPMACPEEEHAVAVESEGPSAPYSMEICDVGALCMIFGIVKGWRRVACLA